MPVKAVVQAQGAALEFGTFTLDPANIAAAAKGSTTVTIAGAKAGDLIFVNAEDLDNRIAVTGAKITAANTATVYINNMYDATTGVDGVSKTYSYMLAKF